VLNIVAGKHRQRPLGRKLLLHQELPDTSCFTQRVAVSQPAPAARLIALRKQRSLGRALGPKGERLKEMARIRSKRMRRAQMNDAARAALNQHLARTEPHRTHASVHNHRV